MKIDNPIILGIQEHISRIELLVSLSISNIDQANSYRLLLTSIYSCRAIIELMLEAASINEIKDGIFEDSDNIRNSLEQWIENKIKYYDLIEKIRIHDFHRFGLIPPDPNYHTFNMNGPIKMVSRKGLTQLQYPDGTPIETKNGNSIIKNQRPLLIHNGLFYDEREEKYILLKSIIECFIHEMPNILVEFKNMIKNKQLEIEI